MNGMTVESLEDLEELLTGPPHPCETITGTTVCARPADFRISWDCDGCAVRHIAWICSKCWTLLRIRDTIGADCVCPKTGAPLRDVTRL
ncbi:MAG TPA: hypothetical protein VHE33_10395 [Acidobacteriaceae bacterium]|nr:hypothetical protein [Acidobacteriaceae bacterium]